MYKKLPSRNIFSAAVTPRENVNIYKTTQEKLSACTKQQSSPVYSLQHVKQFQNFMHIIWLFK